MSEPSPEPVPPPEAGIDAVAVTPHPVLLDHGPVTAEIEVIVVGDAPLTGHLVAPDGIGVELRFSPAGGDGTVTWTTHHAFPADSLTGLWALRLIAGDSGAEEELQVWWRRPPGKAAFHRLALSAREIDQGEPVRVTGVLHLLRGDVPEPLGAQPVLIALVPESGEPPEYLESTVTRWGSGAFSVNVYPSESGRIRAELDVPPPRDPPPPIIPPTPVIPPTGAVPFAAVATTAALAEDGSLEVKVNRDAQQAKARFTRYRVCPPKGRPSKYRHSGQVMSGRNGVAGHVTIFYDDPPGSRKPARTKGYGVAMSRGSFNRLTPKNPTKKKNGKHRWEAKYSGTKSIGAAWSGWTDPCR